MKSEEEELVEQAQQCIAAGEGRLKHLAPQQIGMLLAERDMLLFFCRKLTEAGYLTPPLRVLLDVLQEGCHHDW